MHTEDNGLKKEIGLLFALTLVIGTIIGSGVFMKPGAVLAYSGDSKTALFAWLLGGILTLAGGLTIAEIGTQIPKPAGFIRILKKCTASFGDFCAAGCRLSFTVRRLSVRWVYILDL